jgi:tetratricopeptide (TPR) repeat protein
MSMIDEKAFIEVVRPALACADPTALANEVRMRWKACQVASLLQSNDLDVRRVAAITLGLVGTQKQIAPLARALHDPDDCVNSMAEHSLWSIWFRLGKPESAEPFKSGLKMIESQDYHGAIEHFRRAASVDREFAEAYNQCAIAHYFLGEYDEAIEDCHKALKLMPCHFGAMSGIGHCYSEKGDCVQALAFYQKALEINPRMDEIRDVVDAAAKCKASALSKQRIV